MTSTEDARALRYRWLIFGVLAVGYALVYFHRLCPAVVAVDMMTDLHAGGALLGVLGSAYFYPYALMQLPAGLLSDSWGPRRTVTAFFSLAFAGSVVLGLAPSAAWAVLGRVLVGLGVSMLFVPAMKVLAVWFRPSEFATMTGLLMVVGGVRSLAATTPLAVLSTWLGWRTAFVAIGVLTLGLAGLVWIFVRDRPADLGWPAVNAATTGSSALSLRQGLGLVLKRPAFWALAVCFFFEYAVFFSFTGLWGGPYLMHVYSLSKPEAGKILSMAAYGTVAGSLLLTYLSNRVFRARKPVMILAALATSAVTAVLGFRTGQLSLAALNVSCFALGCFAGAFVTVAMAAAKELFPLQIAGTSTGLANLFPFAGGAAFQPLLGMILERHGRNGAAFTLAGYHHAFLVLFACAVAALAASLLIRETFPRSATQ